MANPQQVALLNPLYLHPNENPSLPLVQPPLGNNNYHSWSRSMRLALMSKNKLGFVTGGILQPPEDDVNYLFWLQCDSMVRSWIYNSVSFTIGSSIMWANTAREMWIDLQERFAHGDHFRLSDLLEEISNTKQGDMSVTEYFTKLKTLWEELLMIRPYPNCACDPACNCGAITVYRDYFESECVIRFLKGLADPFAPVKTQVMLMHQLPHINHVFGMAIKHERQLAYTVGHPDKYDSPIMAAQRNITQGYASNPGATSSQKKPAAGNKYQCTFCGLSGHTEDRCYRKHGFPPGKGKGRGNNGQNRTVKYAANNVDTNDEMLHENAGHTNSFNFTPQQLEELRHLLLNAPSTEPVDEAEHNVNQAAVLSANFGQPSGSYEQDADWIS